jgi:hypothetical protein
LGVLPDGISPSDHVFTADQQAPNSDQGSDGGGTNSPAVRNMGGYGSDATGTSRSMRRVRSDGDLVNRLILHTAGGGNLGPDLAHVFFGPGVFYGHFENGFLSALFDGQATSPATGSATISTIHDRLRIGHAVSNAGSPTELWMGVIRSMYIGVLPPADVDRLVGYEAWASNLVALLPANHPYKNAPPLAASAAQAQKAASSAIAAKGRDAPVPVVPAAALSRLAATGRAVPTSVAAALVRSMLALKGLAAQVPTYLARGKSGVALKGASAQVPTVPASGRTRSALTARAVQISPAGGSARSPVAIKARTGQLPVTTPLGTSRLSITAKPSALPTAPALVRAALAVKARLAGIPLANAGASSTIATQAEGGQTATTAPAAVTMLSVVGRIGYTIIRHLVNRPALRASKTQQTLSAQVEQDD